MYLFRLTLKPSRSLENLYFEYADVQEYEYTDVQEYEYTNIYKYKLVETQKIIKEKRKKRHLVRSITDRY